MEEGGGALPRRGFSKHPSSFAFHNETFPGAAIRTGVKSRRV